MQRRQWVQEPARPFPDSVPPRGKLLERGTGLDFRLSLPSRGPSVPATPCGPTRIPVSWKRQGGVDIHCSGEEMFLLCVLRQWGGGGDPVWGEREQRGREPTKTRVWGQGQTVTVATALGLGGWGAWGQRNLRLPIEKQRQSVTVTEAIRQGHMATDGGALRCPHWHGDRHRKPRAGHLERRRGRLPGGAAGP